VKDEDPFDIGNLRLDIKPPNAEPVARVRRQKRTEPFIQIPVSLMERLSGCSGATYAIAIYLCYQNWKNPGEPITLSNVALEAWGVSRQEKRTALIKLEALGVITTERRGKRAPRIRLR
jgi:hypothetical protein